MQAATDGSAAVRNSPASNQRTIAALLTMLGRVGASPYRIKDLPKPSNSARFLAKTARGAVHRSQIPRAWR
jgi:hypothetical protein